MTMLTLYHAPRSRSSRFIWLLEEIGAPYETKIVGIARGDGSGGGDPANPHPLGKVPALVHDGALVFESSAVALYLSDAFPAARMGPKIGDPLRAAYVTLLAYYSGVLEPAFVSGFLNRSVPRGTAGWVSHGEAMRLILDKLEAGPWLLGETFSAADVLYGSTFALFKGNPMLPESVALTAYVDRCSERPAFKRAQTKDG
jgi:glutathione S-transferase